MLSSAIPVKFPIPFANNASGPYIRPIPEASQIGVTPGAASLYDGFPPSTFTPESSGGVPPAGADFNGLLNQITEWVQWQNAGAPVFYDADFSADVGGYPKGAAVFSSTGNFWWLSVLENNTTVPGAPGASWIQIVPATPGTVNPAIDGVAAPGTSLLFARQDHVHPTDTSRAALSYVNSTFETITAAVAKYVTKLNPTSSGTLSHAGGAVISGDVTVSRTSAPSTGVIYLGNTGTRYVFYDGTNYVMPSADLYLNGTAVRAGILAAQSTANTGVTNAATAQAQANLGVFLANGALGSAFGNSQGYSNVTSSRALGVTYTNSTSRPIMVTVTCVSTSGLSQMTTFVNGAPAGATSIVQNNSNGTVSFVVPPSNTYSVVAGGGTISLAYWAELR